MKKLSAFPLLAIAILFLNGVFSENSQPYSTGGPYVLELLSSKDLPYRIMECSGVEMGADTTFWLHNDKGNKNELFQSNSNGEILKTIMIEEFENNDWEDIAIDSSGNLYLGDFGNNDNERKNLSVGEISSGQLKGIQCRPKRIFFSLEDQKHFPPEKPDRQYDIESMFYFNDKLYLISRDRSKPFRGICKLYQLSPSSSRQNARLLATFDTHPEKKKGAITGADISPDGSMLVLISREMLWIFYDFQAPNFFNGQVQQFGFSITRKFEGVVFKDNCTLYLTNEKDKRVGPQLHCFNICK